MIPKEIDPFEAVISQLALKLTQSVDELARLIAIRDDAEMSMGVLKTDIRKMTIAYEALAGKDLTLPDFVLEYEYRDTGVDPQERARELNNLKPTPLPDYPVDHSAPPQYFPPTPRGPRCRACGDGILYPEYRELSSGRVASLLVCGECKNETVGH